jgi:2-keto-4-pentenoate hydratase
VLDAINRALAEVGIEQFTGIDQVEAVICIVVRKDVNGDALIGRTSEAEVMRATMEFLINTDVITYEFGAKIVNDWTMNKLAAHP